LRADLHLHTMHSRDCLTRPDDIIARCHERGIDCIAVTDHHAIAGALALRERAPFTVIVGEEIKTTGGEVIGLFMRDIPKQPIPKRLPPIDTVKRIKALGGLVVVPHPFDRLRRSPLKPRALEDVLPYADAVEVLNARTWLAADNERSRRLSRAWNLPATAGSDAHTLGEIGAACVEIDPFDGPDEFLRALVRGRVGGRSSSIWVHVPSTIAKVMKRLGAGRAEA
jgi:predicted metal-dependent phosphoesterase TrpH